MPVYEYECGNCHQITEALRKMADVNAPLTCEHCGSDQTKRAHSVVAVSTGGSSRSQSLPMAGGGGGCGRCGGPHGSCGT